MSENQITFQYKRWECWRNDTTKLWGAILSRKGEQAVTLDGFREREELEKAINET
jgi:hypothetical protein